MWMLRKKLPSTTLSRGATILVALSFVTHTFAFGQGLTSEHRPEVPQSSYDLSKGSRLSQLSSQVTPLKSKTLEDPYRPITPRENFRWFVTSTIGPAHLTGVVFVSACGTAVNRPGEYGPHWDGFANRFGIGIASSATGNAMEAGVGFILREDPRYFRAPQEAFKARVGNVARLVFLARNESGRSEPAYGRYLGIVGSNFLSNAWRVHSEANVGNALLRSSEGFAGRMAANAFKEFWPDIKRHVFRKYNRASNLETRGKIRSLGDRARHD